MTRSDLVEELASRFSQLTHRDAEYAVKTILDAMSDALVRGHRIEIRGFGSFSINRRPPRMGRNPRSGESVHIPEKRVPHFKPVPRFYLPLDQIFPQTNASQLIILPRDLHTREQLRVRLPALLAQEFPEVRTRVKLLPN